MYARITPYKMKPGSRDAAMGIMETLKERILGLDGMQQFINVMDGDGKGYVIALTTQAEMTPDLQAKVQALWGAFGDYLEAMPTAENYEILADWTT